MASIQNKNGTYYCQFSHRGKRHTVTAGRVACGKAEAFASGVEDLLEQVRRGRLSIPGGVAVTEFVPTDGKARPPAAVTEAAWKTLTVGDLLARYQEGVGGGVLEKSTCLTLRIHANHLKRLVGEKAALASLTRDALQGYVTRRAAETHRGKVLHPDTPKKEITTLRAAWNWGVVGGLLADPFPGVKLQYPKKDESPGFMPWAEVERKVALGGDPDELWPCLYMGKAEIDEFLGHVKQHATRPWVYPLIFFAAHTGARRGEVLRAELGDVDDGVVTIR